MLIENILFNTHSWVNVASLHSPLPSYTCFKENSYMLVRNPETRMVPVKVDYIKSTFLQYTWCEHCISKRLNNGFTNWITTSFMIFLTLISVRRTHLITCSSFIKFYLYELCYIFIFYFRLLFFIIEKHLKKIFFFIII